MTWFRRLALASTAATFLLVAVGGLVRATKSGLGCGTDWPDCSGKLLPALENRALIIEFSHRVAASIVVVLLGVLAVTAIRRYRSAPRILWPSIGAFGLVLFQAVLGAVVVKLELEAISVVLHLGTAMLLVSLLIYVTVEAFGATGGVDLHNEPVVSKRAFSAAGAVLLLLLVGSYVSGKGAGNVFPDWPLMNGSAVPDLSVEAYAIHWFHRVLALVVGVIVIAVSVPVMRRKSDLPLQAKLAHAAAGLFAVEVLIGAANVWTNLNAAFVTAHLLVGALIWGSLVTLGLVSHPAMERASKERVSSSGRPAYEAGI